MCENMRYPKAGRGLIQQQGIATILLVVLISIALIATTLGLTHSIRNTQEKQVAAHAVAHAQNGVWTGVEAFRRYLGTLTPQELAALDDTPGVEHRITLRNADNAVQNVYGSISVGNIVVTGPVNNSYEVSATVTNVNAQAEASASVGVVFQTQLAGPGDTVTLPATLNFNDDINITGNIGFTGATPEDKLDVKVNGTVTIGSVTLSSIGTLSSTNSITVTGAIADIEVIHSNANVTLTNLNTSGVIGEVQAGGNITTIGDARVTTLKANGNIDVGSNNHVSSINALGYVAATMGNHGTVTAGRTVTWGAGTYAAINAVGDVTITSSTANPAGVLIGEGNVTCVADWWSYGSISINRDRTATNCGGGTLTTGANERVTLMDPVGEVVTNPFTVDVYKLQGHANWIFSYDTQHRRILVRTQNINGIDDGTYMVGHMEVDWGPPERIYYDHLCEVPASGNTCGTLVTPHTAVCLGFNTPGCISYSQQGNQAPKWTLNGHSAAPGIMWFPGDVNMNNGTNYTTILSAGNITTGGSFVGYAVNYAGYDKVCEAAPPSFLDRPEGEREPLKTKYRDLFQHRYPTNLCDGVPGGQLINLSVGNIALAAGGYAPPGNVYSGGDIELDSGNEVYGSVLAGDVFSTLGDTDIFGAVVAANLGTEGTNNSLSSSTDINLSAYPSTYDPTIVPNMANTGGGGNGNNITEVKLLWSKYL